MLTYAIHAGLRSEERLGSASFHPLVLNTKHSWRAHDGARVLHARAAYELFVALGVHAYGAAVGCTRNKGTRFTCFPRTKVKNADAQRYLWPSACMRMAGAAVGSVLATKTGA